MSEEDRSLAQRVAGRARRTLGGGHKTHIERLEAELAIERERITSLEADLDELRRDSLRVAELLDLAEQAFTPRVGTQQGVAPEGATQRASAPTDATQ